MANWVTALQKYDVEIRPSKIVRGQGFCRMLTWSSHLSSEEDSSKNVQISEVSLNDAQSQYVDIIFYLKNGYAPNQLSYKTKRALRLKDKKYELINDVLCYAELWIMDKSFFHRQVLI